ncbi:MAG: hypothetical protein AAF555_07555 [Verrucomicrobiota bacterium]
MEAKDSLRSWTDPEEIRRLAQDVAQVERAVAALPKAAPLETEAASPAPTGHQAEGVLATPAPPDPEALEALRRRLAEVRQLAERGGVVPPSEPALPEGPEGEDRKEAEEPESGEVSVEEASPEGGAVAPFQAGGEGHAAKLESLGQWMMESFPVEEGSLLDRGGLSVWRSGEGSASPEGVLASRLARLWEDPGAPELPPALAAVLPDGRCLTLVGLPGVSAACAALVGERVLSAEACRSVGDALQRVLG